MSIERTIVERLYESRRMDEAWPASLNNLGKYVKDSIRNHFNKAGIDIQNTPVEMINVKSNRDPILKDENVVIIFEFSSYDHVAVWFRGSKMIKDTLLMDGSWKQASEASWKQILANNPTIKVMRIDPKITADLRKKQADRAEAQKGVPVRYQKGKIYKGERINFSNVDKSGYMRNPNKYKDMLAAMSITKSDQIMKDAYDTFNKLAKLMGSPESISRGTMDDYRYMMANIISQYETLDRVLKEYEKAKKQYGNLDPSWIEYSKSSVIQAIKNLRELVVESKKKYKI